MQLAVLDRLLGDIKRKARYGSSNAAFFGSSILSSESRLRRSYFIFVSHFVSKNKTTANDFVDFSADVVAGQNTLQISNQGGLDMSDYVFAIYVHTPTAAHVAQVHARADQATRWQKLLERISKPPEWPTFDFPCMVAAEPRQV
jgi:hypothetical protein